MANRYWVGGTGTWNTTSTTNWSASSGGASGASVPTAADSVFFDQATTYTVTCTGALTCLDITVSAGTVTFAQGTSPTFAISGSMSLLAGTVWSATGTLTFNATTTGKTVTTNGVSISGAITFNGSGGGWTLGSALTLPTARTLTVTQGTFSTSASNFAVTVGAFSGTGSSTRTISLNGSTITLNGTNFTTWNFTSTTNLTFNAGTSTIQTTSTSSTVFRGGGQTYSTVIFGNTSSIFTIYGANTFATLTFSSLASNGTVTYAFDANQTVTGTLTLGSTNTAVKRLGFLSSVRGTQRTLTAATIGTLSDVDFQDIVAAGASSPWSAGTRLGNGGNNTNITFPAAKTVYWNLGGTTQSWNSTGWATSSGGSPAVNNFPLAQDTAVFDATGSVPSTSLAIQNYWIGTLNTSGRTTPSNLMTLSITTSATIIVFGDWVTGTGVTISGTAGNILFFGRGVTQKITSSGQTFVSNSSVKFDTVSGSVQLQDPLTIDSQVVLDSGTLDLNNNDLTLTTTNNFSFDSSNTATRTIAFGTAGINITNAGTSAWSTGVSTNLTTTGTTKIVTIGTGSTTCSVSTGSLSEANAVSFKFNAGTYTLTFLNSAGDTAKSVDFTGFAGTLAATSTAIIYGDLTLATGMTLTASSSAMTFGATSGTQTITSNGKTMDFPITINGGSSTTLSCADALTLGSTRALTFALGVLQLKAGTTNTVGSFATSGTTLKYLQSTVNGTQATISDASGTNSPTYLSIRDSNAAGGATWSAAGTGNINAGNNTGWTGLPAPIAVTTGNFFFMFG